MNRKERRKLSKNIKKLLKDPNQSDFPEFEKGAVLVIIRETPLMRTREYKTSSDLVPIEVLSRDDAVEMISTVKDAQGIKNRGMK